VPKTGPAQIALAQACAAMYLDAEATNAFRAAISADPKVLDYRFQFARYVEDQAEASPTNSATKFQEVEAVMRKAADDFPTEYLPYRQLVYVYSRLKDGPKALAAGQKAAELGKGISDASYVYALATLVAAQYDPTDTPLATLTGGVGAADRADDRYRLALATANKFNENNPTDFRGPYLLGQIAASRSDWRTAAKHAERATGIYPKSALLWNQLGIYRGYSLDRTGAVAALEKAIELEPNTALYHFNVSGWYFSLLEVTKGAKHQQLSWELDPKYKNRKAGAPAPPK
jgi:tetratricopeptide (TPR) repeat protein